MIYKQVEKTEPERVYITIKNSGKMMLRNSPVFFSLKGFSFQKSKCFIGVCDKRIKPGEFGLCQVYGPRKCRWYGAPPYGITTFDRKNIIYIKAM